MTVCDGTAQPGCIPDILAGTDCGRIRDPSPSLIGRRIVYEEHFGTICYVGPLSDSSSTWLGIDWDDPARGRHDGSYKGRRYFQTRTDGSGSFIRPEKVSLGASLEEALVHRYVLCSECQLSSQNFGPQPASDNGSQSVCPSFVFQPVDTSGRLAAFFDSSADLEDMEFSGNTEGPAQPIRIELFTRPSVSQKQLSANDADRHALCGPQGARSALKGLKSATFTLIPVYRALQGPPVNETAYLWPLTGGTLGQLLPNLKSLDLSGCLFTRWVDVAEICVQLPQLNSLNLSSNRLRLPPSSCNGTDEQLSRLQFDLDFIPSSATEQLFPRAFSHIQQLVLIRCPFLNWTELERVLAWMPSLKSLSLAYVELGNMPPTLSEQATECLRHLIELDLTQTCLTDLTQLFTVLGPSTALDSLVLNQNDIHTLPTLPTEQDTKNPLAPSQWFTGLTTLSLRQTKFADWKPFEQLLHLAKLHHLVFWECPVTECTSPETARQEIIARLPSLRILNRMEICAEERRGAELDYLKRYGALWRATGGGPQENTEPLPETGDDQKSVRISPEFAELHPVFALLCRKHGAPESGESKLVTRSLKEGLTSITFILQPPSPSNVAPEPSSTNSAVRRIHGRMTVNHLRTLVRRLFKLPPQASFELAVQGERHKKINTEILLDADTREIGYYCLEDGDTVFVRILD